MAGSDRGRIYRILPKDYIPEKNQQPHPEAMETVELVPLLAHPNRWWRLQAQQLLLERQDRSAVPALKHLFRKQEDPRGRLHALYALEGLSALDTQLRSEEHTSELQSLMRISYAVFCLKKKT